MITREQLTRFIAGELGDIVELTHPGHSSIFWIERFGEDDAVAHVPRKRGAGMGPFDIELAMSSPVTGLDYQVTEHEYVVRLTRRSHYWSIGKMATSHLGWLDFDKLRIRFRRRN